MANLTDVSGCSTCQSVLPLMQRYCLMKDFSGLAILSSFGLFLCTLQELEIKPLSLQTGEGKPIFSNGCSC